MNVQRILHVAATSVPFSNGYTMRLRSLIEQQRARGLAPTVITSPFYPGRLDPPETGVFEGVLHRRCRHPAETGGGGAWGAAVRRLRRLQRPPRPLRLLGPAAIVLEERLLMRRFAAQIRAAAEAERAELIHAHTPYRCALPAQQVACELGLPCVYEMRGIWEDTAVADGNLTHGGAGYRYVRSREDVALRGADAVVAICESLAAEARGRGADPGRTFVAPNGADLPRLGAASDRARAAAAALRGKLPAGDVLGYVGSVRPLEGVDELVEAVASMRAAGRDIVGVVVGDGPSLPALREQAQRLGVADAVAFPGRVPPADVGAFYDLIDVFVVSRRSSRVTDLVTPIKPLEAMGRGKAVVMSDLPALRELGEPGDAARFYRASSVPDLVAVAGRLLDDDASRAALGARARDWVANERTWSRSLDATLVAYDSAARHAVSR